MKESKDRSEIKTWLIYIFYLYLKPFKSFPVGISIMKEVFLVLSYMNLKNYSFDLEMNLDEKFDTK